MADGGGRWSHTREEERNGDSSAKSGWIKIPKSTECDDPEEGDFKNPFHELEIDQKQDDTDEPD